jgi:hypothetical protein
MLVNVAFAGQSVMTALLVRDVLRGDAQTYGVINSAYGAAPSWPASRSRSSPSAAPAV